MTHPIAICGSSYSPRPLDVPLHELLGFRADDYVTIATHGVSRAKTWQAADLSFEYAMRDGKLSQADAWIGAQPVKSTLGDKRASARDILAVRVLYADFDDSRARASRSSPRSRSCRRRSGSSRPRSSPPAAVCTPAG